MKRAATLQAVQAARALPARARATPAQLALPLLLMLAIYLGLFFRLGSFALFDVDEGAFGEATREMLARGDYVTTWLNGELRFDKPILIYWLQALSVALFGLDEFALRLPSALAGAAWIVAIFAFARRQFDRATAYGAALIAATTLGVDVIGRGAIADALLNLFLALTMFDIYRYQVDPRARYRYRVFLWMALGVLTKGPVALLIPFAVSAVAFWLHGQMRLWGRALADPVGWLVLLAVAGPWYALEYLRQGDAFVAGFFMRHNVERFLSPLQGHGGTVLYYLPVLLLAVLPYTGLLLRVLPAVRHLRANRLDTMLWCWFLFVLVFFSLAGTKLPHYLLYGITPLFLLMAAHRRALESRLLAFAPPLLLLLLVVALPYALAYVAPAMPNLYLRDMLGRDDVFGPLWQLAAIVLLLALAALALAPLPLWPRLLAAGYLCAFALAALVLPALAQLQQGPVKEAARFARAAGLQVRTWQFNVPSFSVYRGAVTERASRLRPGEVVLTRSDALPGLGQVQVLYRKGGVVLARLPG
jgi:4-amino-4-deoxy-L-arabinose transferase-like glycosyltransferase